MKQPGVHPRTVREYSSKMTSITPTRREFLGAAIATVAASAASRTFSPDFATALDAAAAVKSKRISSLELTELTFRRIDTYNPTINPVIFQFPTQPPPQPPQPHPPLP